MAQRFISKNSRRKFIRPVRNTMLFNRVETAVQHKTDEKPSHNNADKPVVNDKEKITDETVLEKKKTRKTRKKVANVENIGEENNDKNTEPMNENIEKIKQIVGQDVEIPDCTIKYEKKDKGLIERTENSTILITEENKMLLND